MSGSSGWMKEVLTNASRIDDPQKREAYLTQACGDNTAQLSQLREWFAIQEREQSPLDRAVSQLHDNTPQLNQFPAGSPWEQSSLHPGSLPPGSPPPPTGQAESDTSNPTATSKTDMEYSPDQGEFSPDRLCNTQIGPYKLLRVLGRGGMGVVFEAQQLTPINRFVAIKLIDIELSGTFSRIHFEAERKALELMNHPGITGLLDAGVTNWGAPYYVMELVRGVPIHNYCEINKLPLESVLKLFISLCSAVQHAHQKGIIHRDLKPNNVLVTELDNEPVVKLIDFGIALNKDPSSQQSPSGYPLAFHAGTPMYMSPEQASGNLSATDTRSDVYSLGVILFNLLTHSTPIDRESFEEKDSREIRKMLLERPPARPSEKVADPKSDYAKKLRYELDWIVVKAIEKHPSQRYPTPLSLAEDISNYLEGKVVQAKPPSWQYLSSKWLQTNTAVIIPAAISFVVLAIATVVSLANLQEAKRAQEASKRLLLNADMKLASEAFADGNFRLARERLERHQANLSDEFRNSFPWRYLWKRVHPELYSITTNSKIFDISHHPYKDQYITSHDAGELLLWDAKNQAPTQSLRIDDETIRSVRHSPNGRYIATGNVAGTLRIWRASDSQLLASLTIVPEQDIYATEWISEELLSVTTGETVTILDTDKILNSHLNAPTEPVSSSTFPKVAVTLHQPDGTINREMDCIHRVLGPFSGSSYSIAISPDQKQIAVTTQGMNKQFGGMVTVWNLETWKEICRILTQEKTTSVAYHPDADSLVLPSHPALPKRESNGGTAPHRRYLLAIGTQLGHIQTNLIVENQGVFSTPLIASTGEHTSNIYKLKYSDDGRYLVSVSKDATARVWSAPDLKCLQTIQSHLARVYSLCFKPKSHIFLTVGWDTNIRAMDASDLGYRKLEFALMPKATFPPQNQSTDVFLKTDLSTQRLGENELFVTGTTIPTGRLHTLSNRFDPLPFWKPSHFSLSQNGLVALGRTHAGISEITSEGMRKIHCDHTRPIDIDFDGTPDRVSGFGSEGYLIYQPSIGKDRSPRLAPCNYPLNHYDIQLSQVTEDGTFELASIESGNIAVITKYKDKRIVKQQIYETSLAENSSWGHKALKNSQRTAQVFAAPRNQTVVFYPNFPDFTRIVMQSESTGAKAVRLVDHDQDDTMDLIVLLDDSNTLDVYEILPEYDLKLLQRIPVPPEMLALEVVHTEDSIALYVASSQGIFSTPWDGKRFHESVSQIQTLEDPSWQRPISANLILYDLNQNKLVNTFYLPPSDSIAFALSPDGSRLATASYGLHVRYGDALGRLDRHFETTRDSKNGMAYTPDNTRLCLAAGDHVWFTNPESGKIINIGRSHDNTVCAIAMAQSGKYLATGSNDLCVYLWNPATGQPIRSFVGHRFTLRKIAFSPDERWLATSDASGTVKIWDLQTGGELMELTDTKGYAHGLSFHVDDHGEIKLVVAEVARTHNGMISLSKWTTTRPGDSK